MFFKGIYTVFVGDLVDLGLKDHGRSTVDIGVVKVVHEVQHGLNNTSIEVLDVDHLFRAFLENDLEFAKDYSSIKQINTFHGPFSCLEKYLEWAHRISRWTLKVCPSQVTERSERMLWLK